MNKKRLIIITVLSVFLLCSLPTNEAFAKTTSDTVKTLQTQVKSLKSKVAKLTKENKKLKTQVSNSEKIKDQLRAGLVAFESGSQWEGTYTANQGETSLKLTVKKETVVFAFGPTKKNPTVPYGQFTMLKDYNKKTGALSLEGVKWISKPTSGNYSMVDMVGSISGDYINGILVSVGSKVVGGQFSVKRVK